MTSPQGVGHSPAMLRMRIITGAALAAALSLAGCTGAAPRPPRSEGERLYLARCTKCHVAYEPGQRTPAQWQEAVENMEMLGKVDLSSEDRALILGYLAGAAAAPAAR